MTADELLADAEDLIICQDLRVVDVTVPEAPEPLPCGRCPWCEWRRQYERYQVERENKEAAAIAQRFIHDERGNT